MTEDASIKGAGLSFVGNHREENQDAIRLYTHVPETALLQNGYLLAVADGMGGCAHGDVASNLALDVFFNAFYGETGGKVGAALKSAVQQANVAVQREAARLGSVRMGTTLSAVNIVGAQLHIAHVGDSRVYLARGGRALCLTDDHTQVGELVRMKLLTADKLRTHERRSVLLRAVGIDLFVQPDITQHALQPDDYIVLCTDGIWSVIEDDEIGGIVREAREPAAINEWLVGEAMRRDSDDNASVITIHVRQVPQAAANVPNNRAWNLGKLFNKRRFAGA